VPRKLAKNKLLCECGSLAIRRLPRANQVFLALVCPIWCKSPAQELPHTGDATGFYCTIHGHFKIANTVALDDYYTAEWEVALRAAKHKAMEGEWPVIWPWDFFRERES
jgi:hypothetical protein